MLKPRRGPGSKPRFAAASPVVGSARTIGGVRRAASGGIQFTAHAHSPNIRGVGSPGGVVLPATVGTECDPSLIGPVGGVEPPPTGHFPPTPTAAASRLSGPQAPRASTISGPRP